MGVSFYGFDSTATEVGPDGQRWPRMVMLAIDDPRRLDLNLGNARALLQLLGIAKQDGDLFGEMPVADVRRAVMCARATFERKAQWFTREPRVEMGTRRTGDAVTEIVPRVISGGLDADQLVDRLERFATIIDALAAEGATSIAWG